MSVTPFSLKYSLSRWQRLWPHLRIWGIGSTLAVVVLWLFFSIQTILSIWLLSFAGVAVFGGLWLWLCLMFRGLFVGLVDIVLVPVRNFDLVVEDEAIGILGNDDRWYLFLDGILDCRQLCQGLWTIQHHNGIVLHIPVEVITDEQLEHIRTVMERGRTPEGIQAVIERGRRIEAIMQAEAADKKNAP